ncbi:uncharacterized protein LOC127290391 isoform X2 [Leptopilina boulardi]|uniref:uncharacterized protein LOC127290391 isoform X2 n=1 Tax=Leptopilina boulardi TaxID=63433 RepID=UPI0021F51F05|nr:uncharacterized protein LOC127290391 isoform X2 [Leptopilina boulardi]
MYTPLRIVTSSLISRNKLDSNLQNNEADQEQKVDEINDDFLKNLDYQTHRKIKNDVNNKLKLNNKFFNKRRSFDNKFDNVKKRFETETRIYQTSLMGNLNNNSEEKYKVQMSSADKYLTTIHSMKDHQNNTNEYSLHNRNWVPGQIATKVEDNSTCNDDLSDSVRKNEKLFDKEQNNMLYHLFPPKISAVKRVKNKKKFVESIEFKDKYEKIMQAKKSIKHDNCSLILNKKPDNKTIITPFKYVKTSFFTGVINCAAESCKKHEMKTDITADWVKGEVVKRNKNINNNFDEKTRMKQIPECKNLVLKPQRYSDDSRKDPTTVDEKGLYSVTLQPYKCTLLQYVVLYGEKYTLLYVVKYEEIFNFLGANKS